MSEKIFFATPSRSRLGFNFGLADSTATEVFAGFRGSCLSVYFGSSPVYHFNASRELRRAYADDRLVKAEKGRLVALRRVQSTSRSELLRTTWDEARMESFLAQLHERLATLSEALANGAFEVVGQEPERWRCGSSDSRIGFYF